MARASKNAPSRDRLHRLFAYDMERGVLVWRLRPRSDFPTQRAFRTWNARYAGRDAGGPHSAGYVRVAIDSKRWFAHFVIWTMVIGELPEGLRPDHINGDKADNHISNLRAVTHRMNCRNAKRQSNNTSGVSGVYWNAASQKWAAQITVDRKSINLGCFSDKTTAAEAVALERAKHGFTARHGT